MPAASRIGDRHRCAHHVGGRVLTGCPTVLVRGEPAARVTDVARCSAPDEDAIEGGCETVFIGCQKAARVFDPTDGGYLTSGEPTVRIGPAASPSEVRSAVRRARSQARR